MFFFSSRRRHTRFDCDWSSDVCSSDLEPAMKIIPKRALRCSFCGKSEREVTKLLAGPKVHICDACVDVCNGILEALPRTFAGWDAMTNEQLIASLKPAAATVDATRALLQSQVETLRQ